MRNTITFISDTHTLHNRIDMPLHGDIICHTGDFSNRGFFFNIDDFLNWFSDLDYDYKIMIAGNHDTSVETKSEEFLSKIPDNVIYLENDFTIVNGIKIWGSPVTPTFGVGWAFNRDRGEDIRRVWDGIPGDTDIVLTHGPPHGFGDKILRPDPGEDPHRGCEELLAAIHRLNPCIHAFGHIHEGRTVYHDMENDIAYINSSIVDSSLKPVNNPIHVGVDSETKETFLIDR